MERYSGRMLLVDVSVVGNHEKGRNSYHFVVLMKPVEDYLII